MDLLWYCILQLVTVLVSLHAVLEQTKVFLLTGMFKKHSP